MSNFDARFINFLTILLVLGLVSGFTSCQEAPNHKFSAANSEPAIIGGAQVEAESQFSSRVIYLALGVAKKTTPFGFTISQKGLCTASAITSRILITAAHCVKEQTKEQVYAVMTNNPWNHDLNLNEWIAVEKIKVHKNFVGVGTNLEDDLALIKLVRDLPQERISKLADVSQVQAGALTLVSVGYGKTSPLNRPRPEDDENDSSRVGSQPTLLHSVVKTVDRYKPTEKIFSIEQKDMKGICQGDSGGPGFIFDNNKQDFYILGVTTFVSIFSDEKEERDPQDLYSSCIGRGNYTNLLLYKDWINSSLLELK